MSAPADGLPAWLQLEWNSTVAVGEVQLIFDTGQHRHLTLSHHDGYTQRMQWAEPQQETVCDYSIEICDGDRQWETVVNATGNHQRLCRHRLSDQKPVLKVRVNVKKTNGLDHARIAEVRVYGDDLTWQQS